MKKDLLIKERVFQQIERTLVASTYPWHRHTDSEVDMIPVYSTAELSTCSLSYLHDQSLFCYLTSTNAPFLIRKKNFHRGSVSSTSSRKQKSHHSLYVTLKPLQLVSILIVLFSLFSLLNHEWFLKLAYQWLHFLQKYGSLRTMMFLHGYLNVVMVYLFPSYLILPILMLRQLFIIVLSLWTS